MFHICVRNIVVTSKFYITSISIGKEDLQADFDTTATSNRSGLRLVYVCYYRVSGTFAEFSRYNAKEGYFSPSCAW